MTTIPTLQFPAQDVQTNLLHEDTVQNACSLFRSNGCLLLESVFSPAYIDDLRAAYVDRYSSYFEDKLHSDAATVGDKRFQITVEVMSKFNDPRLYANPLLLPIVQKFLGNDCVIGSFGSVAALPGSPAQHVHRDGLLFGGPIDAMLPGFALTLMVPLIDLNEINGTTRMWMGSHLRASDSVENLPYQDPLAPIGSCMFMDYRLIHAGTANRSEHVRPILYIVYNRPWFKDYRNFYKQAAVLISHAEFKKIPESQRSLFAMAQTA